MLARALSRALHSYDGDDDNGDDVDVDAITHAVEVWFELNALHGN